jgi:hypothetical protein
VSNGRLTLSNDLERIWKEAVVAKFEVPSRHVYGGAEENHEYRVFPSAETPTDISLIRIRNVTA